MRSEAGYFTCERVWSSQPTSDGFAAVSAAGGDAWKLEAPPAGSEHAAGGPGKVQSKLEVLLPVLCSIRINGSLLSFFFLFPAVWLARGLWLSPLVVEG